MKAIRWAADRIGKEGIVAYVTNNSFIDGLAFDGMRKYLSTDFDAIYILDLGGNVRKGLKVSDANVFGIRVGVSINLFVKNKGKSSGEPSIFYYCTDELWNRERKFSFLSEHRHIGNVEWSSIEPDKQFTWLTEGLHAEFDIFIPMGTKAAKTQKGVVADVIFKTYCRGVATSRDAWAYNQNQNALTENTLRMIDIYNLEVDRWKRREDQRTNVNDFVVYDDMKIKWDRELRQHLQRGRYAEYAKNKVRSSLYRPFIKSYLFFDRVFNNCVYLFPSIFPVPDSEKENRVICLSGTGSNKPFQIIVAAMIPCLDFLEKTQCFPFYTYDEDGTNRRENITDWALAHFRTHYQDNTLTKWDIFHYTYGLLHHPGYRQEYEENLKRDLPHIPLAKDFWGFANAGERLAALHVNYESAPKYEGLTYIETPGMRVDWRVEKMKLSKDKTQLKYNDFLTLDGIPAGAFAYRLGNRSALEWVVDQYRVKIDKRSGIVNDPNRETEPRYIVDLIARVLTVSLRNGRDCREFARVVIPHRTLFAECLHCISD